LSINRKKIVLSGKNAAIIFCTRAQTNSVTRKKKTEKTAQNTKGEKS